MIIIHNANSHSFVHKQSSNSGAGLQEGQKWVTMLSQEGAPALFSSPSPPPRRSSLAGGLPALVISSEMGEAFKRSPTEGPTVTAERWGHRHSGPVQPSPPLHPPSPGNGGRPNKGTVRDAGWGSGALSSSGGSIQQSGSSPDTLGLMLGGRSSEGGAGTLTRRPTSMLGRPLK